VSRVAIALARVFSARMFDPQKANRRSQFAALTPPPGRMLFLGDSLTQFAEWAEWFPGVPVLNRGIDGDTVRGVLSRLDTAINKPRAVSLLIGTNDIGGIGETADPDKIADAVAELVRAIRSAAPDAPLLVTGVMPRSASFASAIQRLNSRLRVIAEATGATFVDVWPSLADERGEIRPEFSNDRLHLTGEGYRVWVEALRPHIST
jgi:lysophospholipase L1-like esterase